MPARAAVEALLRERKLDRTLTSAQPERLGEDAVAPLNLDALDRALSGGVPRGQVSEVAGPSSSGRTSLAWGAMAAATRRGEYVALVDTFDRFDPPTAAACGIDLARLLWVRGQAVSKTAGAVDPAWLPGVRAVGGPGTFVERVIDRALKSLNLVVQSRVCTLVVIDLIDVPATALRRLPAATWFRIERAIEGSDTAVLIVAAIPVARSSGGKSIATGSAGSTGSMGSPGSNLTNPTNQSNPIVWKGEHDRSRRLGGVRTSAAISAARSSQVRHAGFDTALINAG
jgi:recombination protein RecA